MQTSFSISDVDVSHIKNWEVKSNTSDYNLERIKYEIELGDKNEGGINLKPFYQREYKFTVKDESLLIESLLGGIPIPVIYLASDTSKVPHVSNVIDGQHRLMAVYRFLDNRFALKGLKKFTKLEGLTFSQLHLSIQNKLLYQISLKLEFIHIQDDPDLEIEIFTRYNQGTNPLTSQEIRHVVFNSYFNEWLINYLSELSKKKYVKEIFNMSKKRMSDKTIHQEFYILLGIYKNMLEPGYHTKFNKVKKEHVIQLGINTDNYSSTDYATEFMSYARHLDELESTQLINECETYINQFIVFLKTVYFDMGLEYPLSKEVFQENPIKNYKMQTSILMIMGSVFKIIHDKGIPYVSQAEKIKLKECIAKGFNQSDFPSVTSSTTEPKFLIRTISTIIDELETCYGL